MLTDVERSNLLWDRDPEEMRLSLLGHDALFDKVIPEHHGRLIKSRGEGDSHFAVFEGAVDAAKAAVALQQALHKETWSTFKPLRVRMALHTGEAEERSGDYYGLAVNKAGRLRSVAHGGQIVLSLATRELIHHGLSGGMWLKDLGEHRLKDLLRPERIFQLCGEGLPEDFPALNSLDVLRTNLPVQLTSFVGREDEIQVVHDRLSDHRLVTLLGPGGCGKTRLSLQVAADRIEDWPDGVWFLDLSSLEQGSEIYRAAAAVLQIEPSPARDLGQDVLEFLKDRKLLLVMDNCEHLGRRPADFARAVLESTTNVKIIATSRRPLRLSWENTHIVRPLTLPKASAETVAEVVSTESGRLMLDRAWSKAPNFKVQPESAPAFGELCRALEGMPLAIELAASRLKVLSPDQIRARMAKSFDLLRDGSEDADPRHQTLRATIDWSFKLLSDPEKEVLRRISILPGGCCYEAAEAITQDLEGIDVLEVIESLIENSLVQVEAGSEPCYRILETIRQYCAELLQPETVERVSRALYDWALEFATEGKPKLLGPEQDQWLKRFEREYENIRYCLTWALEKHAEEPLALELASQMDRYWFRSGMLSEGREWLSRAIESDRDSPLTALLLRSAGTFAWLQRDLRTAEALLLKSIELLRKSSDLPALSAALSNVGSLVLEMGDFKRAKTFFDEALRNARNAADAMLVTSILQNLGCIEIERQRYPEAMAYLQRALDTIESGELDEQLKSTILLNIALVKTKLGHSETACEDLKEALQLATKSANPLVIGALMLELAKVAYGQEHYEMAARLLGCSHHLWKSALYKPSARESLQTDNLRANLREVLPSRALAEAFALGDGMSAAEVGLYGIGGAEYLSAPSR